MPAHDPAPRGLRPGKERRRGRRIDQLVDQLAPGELVAREWIDAVARAHARARGLDDEVPVPACERGGALVQARRAYA